MGENWKEIFGAEWAYIIQLGSAIHDPHAKKEFWENIKARKLADQRFSIYDLFPRHENAKHKAMQECMDHLRSLRRPKKEGESA